MAEYKVTLQDDTVKKLKNMLNIGTVDEEYIIEDNGVVDVDTFIDHTKIKVNIGNVNVHLDDEPLILTTQDIHPIITEEQEGDVTTYSGPRKVKVQVGLEGVTDASQVGVTVDKGVVESNNAKNAKIVVSVRSNVDSSVINKAIDFTIFKEDHKPEVPALDLTKPECIAYYDINEVEDYNELDNLQIPDLSAENDVITLTITGAAVDAQKLRSHALTGTLNTTVEALNELFAEVGYALVQINNQEL